MEKQPFVLCDNLVKIYKVADLEVVALQGLDLEVLSGETMALVGPSGSGKSTLLNVIGGLDMPSAGGVWVRELDLLRMGRRARERYKRTVVGFVWQQPGRNLLPYLSARENVELPMLLNHASGRKRRNRAQELLEMVGLAERMVFRPERLSGGEQQRVAVAVALANNPPLLLADEPTGQIDSESAGQLFESLRRINQAYGTTIIVVTHDPLVARRVDRVVAIRDGRTSTEIRRRRDANGEMTHEEEWVILDQAGRLQLPRPYVENLDMRERVKVRLEPDHVSVWPHAEGQRIVGALTGEAAMRQIGQLSHLIRRDRGPRSDVAVTTADLWRTFEVGVEKVHAVRDISLGIPAGCMAVIKGRSGSGKTTLLNLLAGLDEPSAGSVTVNGRPLAELSPQEKIALRRQEIGFVHQTFGLLPFLSVEENVEVPLRLLRLSRRERRGRTAEALELVGLAERARHRTYELSGGEQQRVAIARALVNRPALILADEPTGQLDTLTGTAIIDLFREVVKQTGITVVIASHDPKVHQVADWVYELQDGRLVAQYRPERDSGGDPGTGQQRQDRP
jgi:peptide/nickel transport system ATP-binding protein